EFIEGLLHRPTADHAPGPNPFQIMIQRRTDEVGACEAFDHLLFPRLQFFQHRFCRDRVRRWFQRRLMIWAAALEITDGIVPDIRKGSDEAPDVAERGQFPSPFSQGPVGLALEVDEKKCAVGTSPEYLSQMEIGVKDAFQSPHACLEISESSLDARTEVEQLGP